MNPWNTLLESYQQRVYKNTFATVKHQIQQTENPTPAEVISTEAAHVDNSIFLDYLTSLVALEDADIGSCDRNILRDNNGTAAELHFRMPWWRNDYEDVGDEINKSDAIPTARWWCPAAIELDRFELRWSNVDRYEGDNAEYADEDEEEEVSQADDGSTQNVNDSVHSTRDSGHIIWECKEWTV